MTAPGTAQWWCWTEDEPSTFRCRERGHDVRVLRKLGDVPTAEWRTAAGLPPLMPGGESTSAQLRRVTAERDALVAFLRGTQEAAKDRNQGGEPDELHVAYERELARLRAENDKVRAELEQEQAKAARFGAAYRHVCTMLAAAVQQRDQARAELGRLRAALAEQSTTDKEPTE